MTTADTVPLREQLLNLTPVRRGKPNAVKTAVPCCAIPAWLATTWKLFSANINDRYYAVSTYYERLHRYLSPLAQPRTTGPGPSDPACANGSAGVYIGSDQQQGGPALETNYACGDPRMRSRQHNRTRHMDS